MRYVGIDVHSSQWTICVLDERGKCVMRRQLYGRWRELVRQVGEMGSDMAVCFEATCGAGWLYDQLRKVAARVVVANPMKLKLVFASKRKNDGRDAERLAKLLFLDEVPGVHIPSRQVRSWRMLIEYRRTLLARCTAVRNRIRSFLRSCGITPVRGLWTKKGLRWLEEVDLEFSFERVQLDVLTEELHQGRERLKAVTRELDVISLGKPGVALVMSIPGVGVRTAEAVVAYIDDARRFARSKGIGSYFGLIPSQSQSGGSDHKGRITRQGPSVVRWLLTEAAWQGIRHSARINEFYRRVARGDRNRRKVAAVATAHYLARVMLAMLKTGEPWRFAA